MDRLAKERLKVYFFGIRPWSRHSVVLLVAGFVYFGIGYAYFSSVAESPERTLALSFILDILSFHKWGIIFMIVGAMTIISARWPPISEKWGYSLLTALSSVWASGYLLSLLFDNAPIENITGFLVWLLVAFLWWAISGLVNPPKVVEVSDGRS